MTEKAAIRKLLPRRAANALFQEGINTFDLIRQSYPEDLFKVPGLGMASFRAVEAALFPGQKYIPARQKISESNAAKRRSEKLAAFLRKKVPTAYDDLS
jgi:hypothetical protein